MEIEFDPRNDAANLAKHGVSLARVAEFDVKTSFRDTRFVDVRFLSFGLLDGLPHSLAYTLPRPGVMRAISLRRAHLREYRRHIVEERD